MSDMLDIAIATRQQTYLWSFNSSGGTSGCNVSIQGLVYAKRTGKLIPFRIAALTHQPLPPENMYNDYRQQMYYAITGALQDVLNNQTLFVTHIKSL